MRKAGLLLLAVLTAGFCTAQAFAQDMQASTDCRTFVCRKPGTVTLHQDGGDDIQVSKLPVAYFDGSVVSLTPGDTVTLGYSKGGGRPVLVSVNDDAGPVDIGGAPSADMMLKLSMKQDGLTFFFGNSTTAPVRYRLLVYAPIEGIVETSELKSCLPAPPAGRYPTYARAQTWLQPASLILVGELESLPPDAGTAC